MAEKVLSSQEVCAILDSCAKNNVTVLKFGGLQVRFGTTAEASTTNTTLGSQGPIASTSTNSDTKISEPNHDAINKDTLETEELLTREEQIQELYLTDPLEAERLMDAEELESDADDEPSDE